MKAAAYVRVSTPDQKLDLQIAELTNHCSRMGWELVETYKDVVSGKKSRRPGLDKLMAAARRRRFDAVLVWKLDRFGRSLVDCLNNIEELDRCGVRFIAVTQGLDTDQRNPGSRFLLQVLGAAAEFERSLIVERAKAGQELYRKAYEQGEVGKTVHSRSGKNLPPHRPRKVFDRRKVLELRRQGMSLRKIEKEMDIGLGTVTRTLKDAGERVAGPTAAKSACRESRTSGCEPKARAREKGPPETVPQDHNRTASTEQANES